MVLLQGLENRDKTLQFWLYVQGILLWDVACFTQDLCVIFNDLFLFGDKQGALVSSGRNQWSSIGCGGALLNFIG